MPKFAGQLITINAYNIFVYESGFISKIHRKSLTDSVRGPEMHNWTTNQRYLDHGYPCDAYMWDHKSWMCCNLCIISNFPRFFTYYLLAKQFSFSCKEEEEYCGIAKLPTRKFQGHCSQKPNSVRFWVYVRHVLHTPECKQNMKPFWLQISRKQVLLLLICKCNNLEQTT